MMTADEYRNRTDVNITDYGRERLIGGTALLSEG